ncbi:MAG: FAD-binding oxidoreductase [Chloroflexi bacterium]|nr:FAD-binding oxidoreductase [Chloroflexota bacterium]
MNETEFVAELNQIVSRDRVVQDEQTLREFARDAVPQDRWVLRAPELPMAVVRPGSTQHVSDILKLATRAGVPVVPYGSGTGVMGAVLDMGSMNKILDVSLEDRLARVQPGVTLAELDDVAQVGHHFVAHDPWSQRVASIGGAISTNGVGYLAAKYGPMGRQVLSLEVVLPTGEIVRTRALPRDVVTGLDMNRLFIGTEGTFGVITEATVRLYPVPEERRHYALSFPSFPNGFFAITRLFSEGIVPAMVDFVEEDLSEKGGEPINADAPGRSTLHLSLEGSSSAEVDAQEATTWEIITNYSGTDMGPEEAQRFWEERHAAGEHYAEMRGQGQRHPWGDGGDHASVYIHTAVPISQVLSLRYRGLPIFDAAGLRVWEVAIWGEPEMFSIAASDPSGSPDGWQRLRAATAHFIDLALSMGGTVDFCHGVGIRLTDRYAHELGDGGLSLMKRLKAAMDPAGIMNPGKLLD